MSDPKRWDDISFKQLKRFWPIIIVVAGAAYAVGTGYANVLSKAEDHEKRLTKVEQALTIDLPKISDGIDELLEQKRRHGR